MTYRPLLDPYKTADAYTNAHLAEAFVSDLDRCEHGRHRVDECSMCADVPGNGRMSRGNPRARGEDPRTLAGEPVLGFTYDGRVYVLVDPGADGRATNAPTVEVRDRSERIAP